MSLLSLVQFQRPIDKFAQLLTSLKISRIINIIFTKVHTHCAIKYNNVLSNKTQSTQQTKFISKCKMIVHKEQRTKLRRLTIATVALNDLLLSL